jgi:hypothetical protein
MQRRLDPGPGPGKLLWEGTERTLEEFRRVMVEEQRLIYQFEVIRTYGMYEGLFAFGGSPRQLPPEPPPSGPLPGSLGAG